MGARDEIGPQADMCGHKLRELVRAVTYEARLADDCTKPGRALDEARARSVLRKINALTQGLCAAGDA